MQPGRYQISLALAVPPGGVWPVRLGAIAWPYAGLARWQLRRSATSTASPGLSGRGNEG